MDKKMARRNMRFGVTLFVVLIAMMATSFIWAWIYGQAVSGV